MITGRQFAFPAQGSIHKTPTLGLSYDRKGLQAHVLDNLFDAEPKASYIARFGVYTVIPNVLPHCPSQVEEDDLNCSWQ